MKSLLANQATVENIQSGRITNLNNTISAYTTPETALANYRTLADASRAASNLIASSAEEASRLSSSGGTLAKTVASRTSNTATVPERSRP